MFFWRNLKIFGKNTGLAVLNIKTLLKKGRTGGGLYRDAPTHELGYQSNGYTNNIEWRIMLSEI